MLPNRTGIDDPESSTFLPRMDTNGNNTPTTLVGHHRNKLDLIRDSLKPFEQPTQEKLLLNAALNNQMLVENSHSIPCPVNEENQRIMINALTQVGYDMESAYYALKLVNFKSVTDAVKVLSSLKSYNTNEPTHLKYALGMQASGPQHNYNPEMQSTSRGIQLHPSLAVSQQVQYPNEHLLSYGQPNTSTQMNYIDSDYEDQYSNRRAQQQYFDSPYTQNVTIESSYLNAQSTSGSRMPVKQSNSFNPATFEQKTKIVKSSSVMETPIRSTLYQQNNKKDNNVPVIRSKLERSFAPAPPRETSNRPSNSNTTKLNATPVQSITVNPDHNPTTPRLTMQLQNNRNELKQQNRNLAVNELSRRTANLQVQTANTSTNESSYSPRSESELEQPSQRVHRCVSPISDSIAMRVKANEYESALKTCRPAMYRFFMEQHTEKIIEQYAERNQRALQLNKEMEAAELPEKMREKLFRYLCQKESRYIRLKRQKMNKSMFEMIKHIGVGAFGKVSLVRKKDTREVYAMKTLSKEDIIQKQQAAHVKAERDILAEANSEWVVKLYYSFQDSQNLYFIMEFIPGGDLMQLLICKGIFSESLSKMYTAELTCAIGYVHELGFIHRDIKPDNVLIDKTGHIKLTDFGLCTGLRWTHDKRHYVSYNDPNQTMFHYRDDSLNIPANAKNSIKLLQYRQHKKRNLAHSIVGTGNYMSPEVLDRSGHTQVSDWWSVGVILYEMVFGRPPFLSQTDDPLDTQRKIRNWRKFLDVNNPVGARLSRLCIDMITKLCCDEKDRLGLNGVQEIKDHPWFKGIDFENLRKTTAEFVPKVEHDADTSNFDTFEVNAEELFRENYSGPNSAYNPAFFDFTFRHFFANDGGQKLNHLRAPQRPKLATLLEAQPSSSGSQSPVNSEKQHKKPPMIEEKSQRMEEVKKPIQPIRSANKQITTNDTHSNRPQPTTTHPIFNRKLQKHTLTNTNEGLPMALHSTYANGSGLPPLAYNARGYEKHGDSNV